MKNIGQPHLVRFPFYLISILILGAASCKTVHVKKTSELCDKGWKILDDNKDDNEKVPKEKATEALTYFDNSFKIDPAYSGGILGKGAAFYYLGNFDSSLANYNLVLNAHPDLIQGYINRSITYMAIGKTQLAIEDCLSARKLDPDDYAINFRLGWLYFIDKDYEKALYCYNQSIKAKEGAGSYFNRGLLNQTLKNYDRAISDYNKALELDPRMYKAMREKGNVYFYQERYAEAIKEYNTAAQFIPKDCELLINRGLSYDLSGEPAQAEKNYLSVISICPEEPAVNYYMGNLTVKNDYTLGIKYFEKAIELNENYTDAIYNRSWYESRHGKQEAAVEDFKKVIKLDSLYINAYIELGNIYYKKKQYQQAFDEHSKAVRLSPMRAAAYLNRAMAEEELGRSQEAKRDYFMAIKLDSNYVEAYFDLGVLLGNTGKSDTAMICYSSAIKVKPDYSFAYHNRGRGFLEQKKYGLALADFNSAIKIDSLYTGAINSRGSLYSDLKKYDLAIPDFLKCIRTDSTYTYPYNNLANCYFKLKEVKNACMYWNLALSHGYEFDPKWRKEFNIEDPKILIQKYCR